MQSGIKSSIVLYQHFSVYYKMFDYRAISRMQMRVLKGGLNVLYKLVCQPRVDKGERRD